MRSPVRRRSLIAATFFKGLALESQQLDPCPTLDRNHDDHVVVSDLVQAVSCQPECQSPLTDAARRRGALVGARPTSPQSI
jgi:hypothetical protein